MLEQYKPWRSVDARSWQKMRAEQFRQMARREELLREQQLRQGAAATAQQAAAPSLQQAWEQALSQSQAQSQPQPKGKPQGFFGNLKSFDFDDAAMDAVRAGGKASWKYAIKPALTVIDAPAEYAAQPLIGSVLADYTKQKIDPATGKPYRTLDWRRVLDDLTGIDEVVQSAAKGDWKGVLKNLPHTYLPGTPLMQKTVEGWGQALKEGDLKGHYLRGAQTWDELIEENPVLQRKAPGLIVAAEILSDPTTYLGPGVLKGLGLKVAPAALKSSKAFKFAIKGIDEIFSTPAIAAAGMTVGSATATQLAHELDAPAWVRMAAPFAGGIGGSFALSQSLANGKVIGSSMRQAVASDQDIETLVKRLEMLQNPEFLAASRMTLNDISLTREAIEKAIYEQFYAKNPGTVDKAPVPSPASRIDKMYDRALEQLFNGRATEVSREKFSELFRQTLEGASKEYLDEAYQELAKQYSGAELEKRFASVQKKVNDGVQSLLNANPAYMLHNGRAEWEAVSRYAVEGRSWYRLYADVGKGLTDVGISDEMVWALLAAGGYNAGPRDAMVEVLSLLTYITETKGAKGTWDDIFGKGFEQVMRSGGEVSKEHIAAFTSGFSGWLSKANAAGRNVPKGIQGTRMQYYGMMLAGMQATTGGMRLKLASYYSNIFDASRADYSPSFTSDRHMTRPLGMGRESLGVDSKTGKLVRNEISATSGVPYLFVQRHMQHVAAELGITPSEMQAVYWIAWTGYHEAIEGAYAKRWKEFYQKKRHVTAKQAAEAFANHRVRRNLRDIWEWAQKNDLTFEKWAQSNLDPGSTVMAAAASPSVFRASTELRNALSKSATDLAAPSPKPGVITSSKEGATEYHAQLAGKDIVLPEDLKQASANVFEDSPRIQALQAVDDRARAAEAWGIRGDRVEALERIGVPHTVDFGGTELLSMGVFKPEISILLPGRNVQEAANVAAFLANRITDAKQGGPAVIAPFGTVNTVAISVKGLDDLREWVRMYDGLPDGSEVRLVNGDIRVEVPLNAGAQDVARIAHDVALRAQQLSPEAFVSIEAMTKLDSRLFSDIKDNPLDVQTAAADAIGKAVEDTVNGIARNITASSRGQVAKAAPAAKGAAGAQQAAAAPLPMRRFSANSPQRAIASRASAMMRPEVQKVIDGLPEEVKQIPGVVEFVASLPPWLTKRLKFEVSGGIENNVVAAYHPGDAVIRIAVDTLKGAVDDPRAVLIHEISHHIEQFFTDAELEALARIWRKEMKSGGWAKAKQYADLLEQKRPLGVSEREWLDQNYRYGGGFREWVAESLSDYLQGKPLPWAPKSPLGAAIATVKSLLWNLASALRLAGKQDSFESIVKGLLESNFRQMQNRNVELFPWREAQSPIARGGSRAASAAAAVKYTAKIPDEQRIPGTNLIKTEFIEGDDLDIFVPTREEFEQYAETVLETFASMRDVRGRKLGGALYFGEDAGGVSLPMAKNMPKPMQPKEAAIVMLDAVSDLMDRDTYLGMRYAFERLPAHAFADLFIDYRNPAAENALATMGFSDMLGVAENSFRSEPFLNVYRYIAVNYDKSQKFKASYILNIKPAIVTKAVPLTAFHEMAHRLHYGLGPEEQAKLVSVFSNYNAEVARTLSDFSDDISAARKPLGQYSPVERFVANTAARVRTKTDQAYASYALKSEWEMFARYAESRFVDELAGFLAGHKLSRGIPGKVRYQQHDYAVLRSALESVDPEGALDAAYQKMWDSNYWSRPESLYSFPVWDARGKLEEFAGTEAGAAAAANVMDAPSWLPAKSFKAQPSADPNDLFGLKPADVITQQEAIFQTTLRGKAAGKLRDALSKVPVVSKLDPNITRDTEITPFVINARNDLWNTIDTWEAYADYLWGTLEDTGIKVDFRDGNFWIGSAPAGDVFEAALGKQVSQQAMAEAAKLTAEQHAAIARIGEFNHRVNSTVMKYAMPEKAGEIGEATQFQLPGETQYFPRVVIGKDGQPRADFSGITPGAPKIEGRSGHYEDRAYQTMFEGQDTLNLNYADPEQAFRTMTRAKLAVAAGHYIAGALRKVAKTEEQVFAAGGLPGVTHYDLGQYIPALSGVYFDEDQAKRILAGLRGRPGFEARAIREVNSVLTPLRAMGDISWLGQQGAYVLFRHPIRAVRTAVQVIISALGDPKRYRDLLWAEIERGAARAGMTADEYYTLLANNGLHQVADDLGEIGLGFRPGGPRPVAAVKKFSNETFGRYLNWARIALANDAVERAMKTGDMEGLRGALAAVNRATGWTSRQPTSLESLAFFAPRFLSSAVEQVFAAVTRGGLEGSIARRHLATLLGTSAIIAIAGNALRGYDTELDGRSPNFLRLRNVGGLDVSLLGTYNTLFRMLARTASGDMDAWKQFAEGKLSPAIAAIYFPLRGRTYLGEPIGFNNPGNLAYQYGKSMLPFPVQALIEEGVEPAIEQRSAAPLLGALPNQVASGMGFASSPMSPAERRDLARTGAGGGLTFGDTRIAEGPVTRDGVAQRLFGKPYDQLTAKEKAQVNQDPEVEKWQREAERNLLTRNDDRSRYMSMQSETREQLAALGQNLMNGTITGDQYRQRYHEIQRELAGARKALGIESSGLIGDWYKLYTKAEREDGTVDYDKLDEMQAQFREKHPEIDDEIAKHVGARDDPVMQVYRQAQKEMAEYMKISPFIGLPPDLGREVQRAVMKVRSLVEYGVAPDSQTAVLLLSSSDPRSAQLAMLAQGLQTNPLRELFRSTHPLLALFYSEIPAPLLPLGSAATGLKVGSKE